MVDESPERKRTLRYQPLRGHLVRLLPGWRDLEARCPIALTDRDRQLLRSIYAAGFLTADQVATAYFGSRDRAGSAAYARLRELWLWGYVDRIQRPVAPAIGGSRPVLQALGPAGVPVVAAQVPGGSRAVQRRRLDRLDDLFVDHDLHAASLLANVTADMRSSSCLIRSWSWWSERELRARADRVWDVTNGCWLPFLPDAIVVFVYPDGEHQVCLIEIDMGSQTLRRFRRKVRAFELLLGVGHFQERWGSPTFEVIVLTTTAARLDNLWRVCREEVPPDRRHLYSLATFDILEPSRWLEGGEFRTLENESVGLYYGGAFACDEVDADGRDVGPPAGGSATGAPALPAAGEAPRGGQDSGAAPDACRGGAEGAGA